ncbi:MAG TPA: hypothetical protein VMZ73_03535 [Acidimicrobiales bacterium]|nr:hypothetical protein [Acidimicrobiales bacterium]
MKLKMNDVRPQPSRRRSRAMVAALCIALATALVACANDNDEDSSGSSRTTVGALRVKGLRAEPTAGRWKTWVLASPDEIRVPEPPPVGSARAKADLAVVRSAADDRTEEVREAVRKWSGRIPVQPWNEVAFDFVARSAKNPPLSSRNYALVNVAAYDAVVAAFDAKYRYSVKPPDGVETLVAAGKDPSYPSEHAAIAGAASRVLAHLYPKMSGLRLDEMAEEAAQSRVQAGVNTPADVSAGLALGRAVADKVIAYAQADGSDLEWDGKRPPGIGGGPEFWEPAPGVASPPTAPMAGKWKPWVMRSGDQFRPPPPPAFGSPEFKAAAEELVEMKKNLTAEQRRIANFWAGTEGTSLPAGILLGEVMKDLRASTADEAPLTVPRSTRAMTLVSVTLADGGIAAWDAKFTYWNPRPINAIRDLGLDPTWEPLVDTPRFPAYPSGSAGYAGGAEAVMTYLFPKRATQFEKRADEQTISRLYAGIHWRYDAVSREAGRKIGGLVVERAKRDGADG